MPEIKLYKEEKEGVIRYSLNDMVVGVLEPDPKVEEGWRAWSFGSGGSTDSLLSLGRFGQLYSMFFRGPNLDYDKIGCRKYLQVHLKALRDLLNGSPGKKTRQKGQNNSVKYLLNGVVVASIYDWSRNPMPENRGVFCSRPAFLPDDEPEHGFIVQTKHETMEEADAMGKAVLRALYNHLYEEAELPEEF